MKKIILLTLFSLVFFVGAILIILNRLNIKVPIPNSPYYKSFFGVYERECNNSLFIGVGCSPMYIKINNANPRTYQVLKYDSSDESEQYSYAKDDNNVFWYTEIIPEADLDTFKAVARGVAIDKNDVYLSGDIYNKYYFDQNGKELSESFDPNTFKILHRTNNHELLQDKSGIYYKRSNVSVPKAIKLEIADVESFKVESSDIYSAPPFPEKYAQYYIKNKFFSDDPYIIATDKNFVYIATNGGLDIVESLSPNTLFNKIAVGYYRINNTIYCYQKPLPILDPSTFTYLGGSLEFEGHYKVYATDGQIVYFCNEPILNSDPVTFTIIPLSSYRKNGYAFDKNNKYSKGKPITHSGRLEDFDRAYKEWQKAQSEE